MLKTKPIKMMLAFAKKKGNGDKQNEKNGLPGRKKNATLRRSFYFSPKTNSECEIMPQKDAGSSSFAIIFPGVNLLVSGSVGAFFATKSFASKLPQG